MIRLTSSHNSILKIKVGFIVQHKFVFLNGVWAIKPVLVYIKQISFY